jgi:hypothetical protein
VIPSKPKNVLLGNLPSLTPKVSLKPPMDKINDSLDKDMSFIKYYLGFNGRHSDFEIDLNMDLNKLE